jgi:hypothetical protein
MIAGKHIQRAGGPVKPGALRKAVVEFMPGRATEVEIFAVDRVPTYCVCRLVKLTDGKYGLVPQNWFGHVKLTERLPEELGLPCSYKILYYLCISGFIACTQTSPRSIWLDLGSLTDHFRRTEIKEGEPSWWTKERLATYNTARSRWSLESAETAELEAGKEERFALE